MVIATTHIVSNWVGNVVWWLALSPHSKKDLRVVHLFNHPTHLPTQPCLLKITYYYIQIPLPQLNLGHHRGPFPIHPSPV